MDRGNAEVADTIEPVAPTSDTPLLDAEPDRAATVGASGDEREDALRDIHTSMAQAEGGDPSLVHHDSNRVNVGEGSWTGSHVVRLLELYLKVATDNGATDTLFGYFGGKASFESVQNRFRRDGSGTVLSKAEEAALSNAGKDPVLREAQTQKGAEDAVMYLDEIKGYSPSWPWLDGAGKIGKLSAIVMSHAAHQAGSSTGVYKAVLARFGGTAEKAKKATTEAGFLNAVRDQVVGMVGAAYRQGVKNRYNTLMDGYANTDRVAL